MLGYLHNCLFQTKIARRVVSLLIPLCALLPVAPAGAQTADPNALPVTRSLLTYLVNLERRTPEEGKRVLSGQDIRTDSDGFNNNWLYIDQTYSKTPGLMEIYYYRGPLEQDPKPPEIGEMNQKAIPHWNTGGLVTVTLANHNPKTGRNWNDPDFTTADWNDLLASCDPPLCNAIRNNFFKELDYDAEGLQELSNNGIAGIAVILRPFAEMNFSGAWYYTNDADRGTHAQFKELWRQTFNYLTVTKNVHNLLFAYGPLMDWGFYAEMYPGSAYVDTVGLSYYRDVLPGEPIPVVGGYDELTTQIAPGKPFGFGEYGPQAGDTTVFDPKEYNQLINGIRQNMPKVVYWTSWSGIFTMGLAEPPNGVHLNVGQLLSDPWVVNLGDITPHP